ncbi:transcription termination/antitermination factor NusG [Gleimia coleocanis DSM 15436]|uniref:Transcription termination/antitermination protein NusG n=1 Tax=Gleimia coleocanis DSM 15436 TaxID=525245 RepID=C0VYZ6_9ACTO|nr:transcription termination/antitermination protein NusG [Gleimia coleocanis]EEH64649.1 transcription termination/antitermination factor NusG [Gleimia coleocanis DSM 15436]
MSNEFDAEETFVPTEEVAETALVEETAAQTLAEAETAAEIIPEPAEMDIVATKRAELMEQLGDWYVIHTYSGHERRVKANLEQRIQTQNMENFIFEAEVPMETVTELTKSGKKTVERPRIPGYVIVRTIMTEASWRVVKDTPAVLGFVGDAQNPVPLSIDEVVSLLAPMWEASALKKAAATEIITAPAITFEIGESVTVVDGPFESMEATVTEIDAAHRKLTVSILIFERETPIELNFDQVKKLS